MTCELVQLFNFEERNGVW